MHSKTGLKKLPKFIDLKANKLTIPKAIAIGVAYRHHLVSIAKADHAGRGAEHFSGHGSEMPGRGWPFS